MILGLRDKISSKRIRHSDLSTETIYELCPHPTKQNCNKSWCKGNTDFCSKKIDVVLVSHVFRELDGVEKTILQDFPSPRHHNQVDLMYYDFNEVQAWILKVRGVLGK